jgi:lysozyme
MKTLGCDVSKWQGEIDWPVVACSKLRFAIIRATHGTKYDKRFARNWSESKKVGVPRGAYHLIYMNEPVEPQVDHFLQTVGPLERGDLLALDIECKHIRRVRLLYGAHEETVDGKVKIVGGDKRKAAKHAYKSMLEWLMLVRERTGIAPLLYISPRSVRKLKGHTDGLEHFPLWLVDYDSSPSVPAPWTDWTFWQFTSDGGGKSHGMESSGLDLNWYNGPVSDLEKGSLSVKLHELIDYALDIGNELSKRRAACDKARVMLAELREGFG